MSHFANLDPGTKSCKEQLRKRLLESDANSLRSLGYELARHPQRGELTSLLDELSREADHTVRHRSLSLMVHSFPDLPRTVAALTRAAGAETSFKGFREVVELGRSLKATRPDFLSNVVELMTSHLSSTKLTFPIQESAREKEVKLALRLSSILARFRKTLQRGSLTLEADAATREAFRDLHSSLLAELENTNPGRRSAWQPPRSRQQRIEALLSGEDKLTRELFRMLTSRDTFENLKRLLTENPDSLKRCHDWLELEGTLSDEQMNQLWDLMDAELKEKCGREFVDKCAASLNPSTLCRMAHDCASVAEDALQAVWSDSEKMTGLARTAEEATKLLKRHPSLEVPIWRVFSQVLTPPKDRFPIWEYSFDAGSANVIRDGPLLYLSTSWSLICFEIASGKVVWKRSGENLPMVYYTMGLGDYLAQDCSRSIFWMRNTENELKADCLEGPDVSLAETSSFQFGPGAATARLCVVPDSHYGEGRYDCYKFDQSTRRLFRVEDRPELPKSWDGYRLEWPNERRMIPGLPCTPTICAFPCSNRMVASKRSEGARPSFLPLEMQDYICGLEDSAHSSLLRVWATP